MANEALGGRGPNNGRRPPSVSSSTSPATSADIKPPQPRGRGRGVPTGRDSSFRIQQETSSGRVPMSLTASDGKILPPPRAGRGIGRGGGPLPPSSSAPQQVTRDGKRDIGVPARSSPPIPSVSLQKQQHDGLGRGLGLSSFGGRDPGSQPDVGSALRQVQQPDAQTPVISTARSLAQKRSPSPSTNDDTYSQTKRPRQGQDDSSTITYLAKELARKSDSYDKLEADVRKLKESLVKEKTALLRTEGQYHAEKGLRLQADAENQKLRALLDGHGISYDTESPPKQQSGNLGQLGSVPPPQKYDYQWQLYKGPTSLTGGASLQSQPTTPGHMPGRYSPVLTTTIGQPFASSFQQPLVAHTRGPSTEVQPQFPGMSNANYSDGPSSSVYTYMPSTASTTIPSQFPQSEISREKRVEQILSQVKQELDGAGNSNGTEDAGTMIMSRAKVLWRCGESNWQSST